MEHAPRVGACKRRGKEGSFGGNLGHTGNSERQFRKQSGSWGAADGGSLVQWGQLEGSFRLQGSIGEGMFAVFYRKC